MENCKSVAIVGGGAAGCFCAIELKRRKPSYSVTIFEALSKPLAKVAITGGGRCNFTNSFAVISKLEEAYPRGCNLMKRALKIFDHQQVIDWFEAEGVSHTIQPDQCVFPSSQSAAQIVNTLLSLLTNLDVQIKCNSAVEKISFDDGKFHLQCGSQAPPDFDYVVVTTGGGALKLLDNLQLEIVKPIPSLFSVKIDESGLKSLMGIVAPNARLSIAGTSFKSCGPLLITDWGLSGPAILKLTSYSARYLAEHSYKGTLLVNWMGEDENAIRSAIENTAIREKRKLISNVPPEGINARLWKYLLSKCNLRPTITYSEMGSKTLNKLVSTLSCDAYTIEGRCHFKSEFVTCGGVSLKEININTMESKRYKGLFFAGEVLDIDAITGGFNLQAAWTTGYVAASALGRDNVE